MGRRGAVRATRAQRRLAREVERLDLPPLPSDQRPVDEADLAALPAPAQRFLRAAGVVGRRRDREVRVRFDGRFRLRPGQPFLRCRAWQYARAVPVARAMTMRIDLARVVPLFGVDTYAHGRGRMHGTLLGVVPVVDASGPEMDVGELTTWLDDVCLLAPSMLLAADVVWTAVADDAFDLTVRDAGLTATARVTVDEHGRLLDVTSTDRWAALPSGLVRARWSAPVDGWARHGGRELPTGGRAVWQLPQGPYEYARGRFAPETLEIDDGSIDGGSADDGSADGGREPPARTSPWRRLPWAASVEESRARLPGDELVPEPAISTTLGVTVHAPAEEVWRWLVQIGQDRGGMYSYDWLENLVGLRIHSADEVREPWQHLAVGDRVRLVPAGWGGAGDGLALPVVQVEPARALVLLIAPPQFPWTAVWSFHLVPTGPDSCRLLSRSREADRGRAARAGSRLLSPITFVMTRKMLLGIRDRAERATAAGRPRPEHEEARA